jgi:uncharacterized membrane protein
VTVAIYAFLLGVISVPMVWCVVNFIREERAWDRFYAARKMRENIDTMPLPKAKTVRR